MELTTGLWVLGSGGTLLLEEARRIASEDTSTMVACLIEVGIRRYVAGLLRLGHLQQAKAEHATRALWAAATTGSMDVVLDLTPLAATRPYRACRHCNDPCRARAVVSSNALPLLSRYASSARAASAPSEVAKVASRAAGACRTELRDLVDQPPADVVAYCVGAHLAHRNGATVAWLDLWGSLSTPAEGGA